MFVRDLLQPWHLLLILILIAGIVAIVLAATRGTRQPPMYPPQAPPLHPFPPRPQQPATTDPTATLAQAKSMLDQGLITQAEYDEVKRNILARMQR